MYQSTSQAFKPTRLTIFARPSEHSLTPLTEAKFVIRAEKRMSIQLHGLTPATPSSSRLNVEQCISSTNDGHFLHHRSTLGHVPSDQDSTRSILQSFLQFLDRPYHHDGVNSAYKDIIRVCITEMLASCQSEATMMNEDTRDSSTDLRGILAFQHLQGQSSDQAYDALFQESVNTLSERADLPFRQPPPDLSISHASHFVATQPFLFVPEIGTCSDAQPLSGGRHQQLRLPTVQGGEEKVRCTWLGCSRVVKRDSHARHVDECHLRKVRDVCTGCGRGFSRMYMKKNHLCQGPLSKRRSF
ncbi:hypothetical protein M405DRAFT_834856 [Rhizopogon salebrosus TDB-379]|nr:hypothetical protein M405DRAFT_834856 [Rhizopogon salebrosus TDB-379]